MSQKRNLSIESLRGIGCISIVIYHLIYRYIGIYQTGYQLPQFMNFWDDIQVNLGILGVNLFFAISFIFPTKNNNSDSFIGTLFKKYYRLWLPYVISISITFLASQFLDLHGRVVDFKTFLVNITMLQGVVGYTNVDGAHWFIFTLLFLNLWEMVIEHFTKCKTMAYFAFLVVGLYCTETSKLIFLWQNQYASVMVFTIMIKYIIHSEFKIQNENVISGVVAIVSLLVMTCYWNVLSVALTVLTVVIVAICSTGKMRFLENEILTYIGSISYFVYLIHQNMSYMIMNTLCKYFGEYKLWYALVCLPIIWGLALLIKFLTDFIKKRTAVFANKILY